MCLFSNLKTLVSIVKCILSKSLILMIQIVKLILRDLVHNDCRCVKDYHQAQFFLLFYNGVCNFGS